MTTYRDMDMGGSITMFERTYLGPTLGWTHLPVSSIVTVTSASYTVTEPTTVVRVNVGSAATIQLGSAIPLGQQVALPKTIEDVSGNAGTNHITIVPAGTETINGLSSIVITVNYGSFTLVPQGSGGWLTQ